MFKNVNLKTSFTYAFQGSCIRGGKSEVRTCNLADARHWTPPLSHHALRPPMVFESILNFKTTLIYNVFQHFNRQQNRKETMSEGRKTNRTTGGGPDTEKVQRCIFLSRAKVKNNWHRTVERRFLLREDHWKLDSLSLFLRRTKCGRSGNGHLRRTNKEPHWPWPGAPKCFGRGATLMTSWGSQDQT